MDIIKKIKENPSQISSDIILAAICGFAIGIIVGFLLSPIKRGICIGSYNGSYNEISNPNMKNKE